MIRTFHTLSLLTILFLCGCAPRGLRRLFVVPRTGFTATQKLADMTVQARLCRYEEIQRCFSSPHDFYHYYHLVHVRMQNQSYVRYTLQADKCSFFVPSANTLRPYTRSKRSGWGAAASFLSAVLFFPIYVISMLKAAVESPPYLVEPDVVVPRPFGILSVLYGVVSLGPFVLGSMAERSASDKYFAEADKLILTQRRQMSIPPYKSVDALILTPRASFTSPCSLTFYNHKSHELEKVVLPVKMVW